jgi:hypothetical protein
VQLWLRLGHHHGVCERADDLGADVHHDRRTNDDQPFDDELVDVHVDDGRSGGCGTGRCPCRSGPGAGDVLGVSRGDAVV